MTSNFPPCILKLFRIKRNRIYVNMVMIALINNLATTHLLRPQAVRLICRLAAVLLDSGGVTTGEYDLISKTLQHLAVKGELPPAIKPKLITPQEAATMLGISYSQFRALEKEGAFPFKRKLVGNKTVRYRITDIVDYINAPPEESSNVSRIS